MHKLIRVTCPTCGDVEIPREDITLMISASDPANTFYFAVCSNCSDTFRKDATPHTVAVLTGTFKVCVIAWDLPNHTRHTGPAINYDDLLDLHVALESTDYLVDVMA